jgi:hypothetical protein
MKVIFGLILVNISFLISSLYTPALRITKALGCLLIFLEVLDINLVPYNRLFSFLDHYLINILF